MLFPSTVVKLNVDERKTFDKNREVLGVKEFEERHVQVEWRVLELGELYLTAPDTSFFEIWTLPHF